MEYEYMGVSIDDTVLKDFVWARVAPLLYELGIANGQYTGMDLLRIEKAVISDAVVFQRKRKYAQGAVIPSGAALLVVQDMTPAEREALVGRVVERLGAKVGPVGTPKGVRVVG